MNIKHMPIQSSHIASAGYDSETQMMEVSFKNGRTYRYDHVSIAKWNMFLAAPSQGEFLRKVIVPEHKALEIVAK